MTLIVDYLAVADKLILGCERIYMLAGANTYILQRFNAKPLAANIPAATTSNRHAVVFCSVFTETDLSLIVGMSQLPEMSDNTVFDERKSRSREGLESSKA